MEFRNLSWLQRKTFSLLEKYEVAYTVVDEPLLPPDVYVTSDIAYFRWHGRGSKPWFNYKYSKDELEESAPRVVEAAEKVEKVLGYFNNHFHGYAPENCLQIMRMLGIVTTHGDAALQRILSYRKGQFSPQMVTLDAWTASRNANNIEKLLQKFAGNTTIEKAKIIPTEDLSLREDSKRRLAAYMGNTTVDIDFQQHTITHYCPLWSKTSIEKKFCPHVTKLFLCIDQKRANKVLSDITSTPEEWKFESRLAVEFPK